MIAKLLISPQLESRIEEIDKTLSKAGLSKTHPDVFYLDAQKKLGIEQARQIKKHFSLKPNMAKGKAVVLEDASVMTVEAQNALLKTLEEPPSEAILILAAPSDVKLLPTILSRCQIIHVDSDLRGPTHPTYEVYAKDMEGLLESGIEERFEYVEKLKDREKFLRFMVYYSHQSLTSHPKGVKLDFLKELLQAEEWVEHNVNPRAILEYLMLVLPTQE